MLSVLRNSWKICLFSFFCFTGCQDKRDIIKVGVTAGPHATIMNYVAEQAKAEGLKIQLVEFNEFVTPNTALEEESIDANSFQHLPYLEKQIQDRGYQLVSFGRTVLMPIGIYSGNYQGKLEDLPHGSVVAIPNDPTNEARALKLLEKVGLIILNDTSIPTVADITSNAKDITIKAVEAPQLPRLLPDVAVAVINTDWVLVAGLNPQTALALEDIHSPYANIIAVRKNRTEDPHLLKLVKLYQSDATKEFIASTFKGAVIPAW